MPRSQVSLAVAMSMCCMYVVVPSPYNFHCIGRRPYLSSSLDVTCHMSCITMCQLSCVTCHVSTGPTPSSFLNVFFCCVCIEAKVASWQMANKRWQMTGGRWQENHLIWHMTHFFCYVIGTIHSHKIFTDLTYGLYLCVPLRRNNYSRVE